MAYTQAQLTALESAIARGVTRVTYDGTTTEYRSLAEMRQIAAMIQASLDDAAGTNQVRQILARPKKGI